MKDLIDILTKINLPDELKYLIDAAINVSNPGSVEAGYGFGLLTEVFRYALVAGSLAANNPHDVIHAHDWLTILAAIEAKRISKKPLIFHIHALETDRCGDGIDKRIYAIEKYGMEHADRVITVSQYTKTMAIKHYGIDPAKIVVVHNGIYLDEINQQRQIKPERPPMVLFLGRITQQKGPYFFIKVAKTVLSNRKDVHFVIAGTGDLLFDTIEKVAELRIGQNVHFVGFLDKEKVSRIFSLADVYVMPSVSEPFGLACLEALAHNVPAIITKQSGAAEVLNHILVADFWDTDDMAAKILALFKYKALRDSSITNSRKDLKDLTWCKTATAILDLYRKIQGV